MMKKYLFLLIATFGLTASLFPQTTQGIPDAHETERRLGNLESFQDNTKKELELKFQELELTSTTGWTTLAVEGGAFIVVLLGGYFTVFSNLRNQLSENMEQKLKAQEKKMEATLSGYSTQLEHNLDKELQIRLPKLVQQESQEEIRNLFDQKEAVIQSLIQREEETNKLKRNARLVVLCESETRKKDMQFLMERLDLGSAQVFTQSEIDPPSLFGETDIVVLDHEETHKTDQYELLTDTKVTQLIDTYHKKVFFLYFGAFNKELGTRYHLNFANSRFTLHDRIVNILRFKHVYARLQEHKTTPIA